MAKKMRRFWVRVLAVNKKSARRKAKMKAGKRAVVKNVTLAPNELKAYYVQVKAPMRSRRRRR